MLKVILGLGSILTILALYFAALHASDALSPQGCRMSWMSPSYVLQTAFNSSWSPLGDRYSLWLYREVGWNSAQIGNSLPVLFIPGNAGSSHQVRSIASSTARQYYGAPGQLSPDFASRTDTIRPLDVYAVDFNEDLSAFHGTTLSAQVEYTKQAITYILSLYPPNTRILVMGHSMGGIVAASLLPSTDISAIITMAAPYSLPPARFDSSIDTIYHNLHRIITEDPTPIVSLCGGATDKQIPSESCILPASTTAGYRKTIFTSALEGCWTGVGHEVIVWCHQVRWRVARAALELSPHISTPDIVKVLHRWFRDGRALSSDTEMPAPLLLTEASQVRDVPIGDKVVLTSGTVVASGLYRLPIPRSTSPYAKPTLTVLLSRGTIAGIGPQNHLPLKVSVFKCNKTHDVCPALEPTALKLIPNPIPGHPFPAPKEGSDEAAGVVLFEAEFNFEDMDSVIIQVERMEAQGWLVASVDEPAAVQGQSVGMAALFKFGVTTPLLNPNSLKQEFFYPSILSHALVAYRLTAVGKPNPQCSNILFPPLVVHEPNPDETHYFPLRNRKQSRTLLHTHSPAPFIPDSRDSSRGLRFSIYSSGLSDCESYVHSIRITIDWRATIGQWASRYWMSVLSWAVGVVAINMAFSMDRNGTIAPVSLALSRFVHQVLPRLLGVSALLSVVPLPKTLYLGNGGEPWFAILAPLVLMISTGIVIVIWWILSFVIYILRAVRTLVASSTPSRPESSSVSKNTLASIALLFLSIFLFVPWQVAFLGCWVYHFYTCTAPVHTNEAYAPQRRSEDNTQYPTHPPEKADEQEAARKNTHYFNEHLLLLMTWLLPLVAPILAVWVRTLATAGLTTPFDGDHNFLNVAPFLILVDFASWAPDKLFTIAPYEKWISARWLFAAISIVAFVCGSRNTYNVYRTVSTIIGVFVVTKVGGRYWRA